jgi:transcriptional regulator with GAF, ATPase, and Fis domain
MVRKIVYWTTTGIVAVMLLFALSYLTGSPQLVSGFTKAGYPQHLRIMLGIAKPAAAIVLLLPGMAYLESQVFYFEEVIKERHNFEEMVGASPAFKKVIQDVEKVARSDSTVLICGETGTGKELIAHAIHAHSSRKDRPLITVNCAALPAGVVESGLFGHEKGAFTGAFQRKLGRFQVADGGTIFLDEAGELSLETQTKFLRVLQQGEFERVGGTQPITVDVRVLAATNQPLGQLVAEGKFRIDLFYRLNVFPIVLPVLRAA